MTRHNSGLRSSESAAVRLVEVCAQDIDTLYEFERDVEGHRMAMTIPRSRTAHRKHWESVLRDPAVFVRMITYDDAAAGVISSFPLNEQHYVGYWISKAHRNRGIATEALRLLLSVVSVRPLTARVASSNYASVRVLEKNEFRTDRTEWSDATDRFQACEETVLILDQST